MLFACINCFTWLIKNIDRHETDRLFQGSKVLGGSYAIKAIKNSDEMHILNALYAC